jgi:hypothetical protein
MVGLSLASDWFLQQPLRTCTWIAKLSLGKQPRSLLVPSHLTTHKPYKCAVSSLLYHPIQSDDLFLILCVQSLTLCHPQIDTIHLNYAGTFVLSCTLAIGCGICGSIWASLPASPGDSRVIVLRNLLNICRSGAARCCCALILLFRSHSLW